MSKNRRRGVLRTTLQVKTKLFCLVASAVLLITGLGGGIPALLSAKVFADPDHITITSPKGGEDWQASSIHYIDWTNDNSIDKVNIDYTLDGNDSNPTWTNITNYLSVNTGSNSYEWTLPNVASTTYDAEVKIQDSYKDSSNYQSTSSNFTIDHVPSLSKPIASSAYVNTDYQTPVTIDLTSHITGSDISSINVVNGPYHGTTTISGESVTYTPNNNFYGSDNFYYTATNAAGTSNSAKVTIDVANPPAPNAVDLVSPSNASFTNDTQPTLTWDSSTYANNYDVKLSQNASLIGGIKSYTDGTSYTPSYPLSDGTWYWQISACDSSGCTPSATWNFTVDTAVPDEPTGLYAKFQYDSTNLSNGSYLNITSKSGGNSLELLWNTPTDWVTGYHVLVTYPDGSTDTFYQGPNTNAWLATYDGFGQHGNGEYSYQVVAVNPNGDSTASASFNLYYDTTKPTVEFTSPTPSDGAYVNSNFNVGYEAQDNLKLKSVNVSLYNNSDPSDLWQWVATCYNNSDETSATDSGTCTVVLPADLSDGAYVLQISAQDQAGNWSIDANTTINVDRAVPDEPTGLYAKFQYDSTNLSNGSYLNITSKSGGNSLELLWNTPTDWVTGYHVLVTYPDGSTDTFYQGPNTNAWLATYDGFGQHGNGEYSYQVVAVNPNGDSTASASFNLYYDTTKPTVEFTSANNYPKNNAFYNGNIKVKWAAHDNEELKEVNVDLFDTDSSHVNHWVATCYSNLDETTANDSGTCTITLPAGLPDGTYYVQVGAEDQAGNWSVNAVRYVKIDRTKPTVDISSPINGNYYGDNTVPITATLNDSESGIADSKLVIESKNSGAGWSKVYDSDWTTSGGNFSYNWDTSAHSNGEYRVIVYAKDGAGNTNNQSVDFYVDNTPPSGLANSSPTNGAITTTDKLTSISWTTASDPEGPVSYYYESSNTDTTNPDGSFSSPLYQSHALSTNYINTSGTPEGTYYWHVKACDALGNCTSWTSPWEVIVDDTAPNTGLVDPSGTVGGDSVALTGYVNDTHFDYYYCYLTTDQDITVNGTAYTTGEEVLNDASGASTRDSNCSTTWAPGSGTPAALTAEGSGSSGSPVTLGNFNIAGLPSGSYTANLVAYDLADNNNAASPSTITFTIDHTPPTTPVASVTAGTYTVAQLVSLSSTDNSGGTPTIYYTTDGSTPSDTNGTLYTGPISIDVSQTLQAVAYDAAGNESGLLSASYVINNTTITFANLAITGGPGVIGGGGGGGNGGGGTGAILGANTTNNGQVKGAHTSKSNNPTTSNSKTAKSASEFLGLGWWWLLVLAIIAFIIYLLNRRRTEGQAS